MQGFTIVSKATFMAQGSSGHWWFPVKLSGSASDRASTNPSSADHPPSEQLPSCLQVSVSSPTKWAEEHPLVYEVSATLTGNSTGELPRNG